VDLPESTVVVVKLQSTFSEKKGIKILECSLKAESVLTNASLKIEFPALADAMLVKEAVRNWKKFNRETKISFEELGWGYVALA